MNIFNRLFGKKTENQGQSEPGQKQETQQAAEIPAKENIVVEQKVQTDESTKPEKEVKLPGEQKPQKEKPEAESANQTIPWRTFSIFISSTFADMQAERDHLKNNYKANKFNLTEPK
jgi:hypothetical protein